jgi:hypothetical protein
VNRTKLRAVVAAGIVAAPTTLGCADAFAGTVTWDNVYQSQNGYDGYLSESYGAGGIEIGVSGFPNMEWIDTKFSDGAWTEVNEWSGHCLDSNFSGSVYPHSCISGDLYQRWYEISTPTGWALEDEETGLFLDYSDSVGIYTNTNYGDSDSHQRWR